MKVFEYVYYEVEAEGNPIPWGPYLIVADSVEEAEKAARAENGTPQRLDPRVFLVREFT